MLTTDMPTIAGQPDSADTPKHPWKPVLYRPQNAAERQELDALLSQDGPIHVHDQIMSQLRELMKVRNPGLKAGPEQFGDLVLHHLDGSDPRDYGVWAYYPWNRTLVHLLDEEEFIEVRTNRNMLKITAAERDVLRSKKIGIAGLSVGHSIALTLATERTCGELRLADFDELELSNLNRIRSTLTNMGLPKVILAAREIAEIDPYISIRIFPEGLQPGNMDAFFSEGGDLDLFVEVCDSLDVKLESRLTARRLRIPVVMDTNDRGMLDVERFDLEPGRRLFHGLLDNFSGPDGIVKVTPENRGEILMALVSFGSLSERMKRSMAEIGKTISTWPQLASSVILGGAITTDISRKILLGQHSGSGRYYVDLDVLFEN